MKHHRYLAAGALALPLTFGALSVQAADIVQTLRDSGQFSTLVKAIEQAGLAQTLKGQGPFTVFAPTDAAFNNLPQGVRSQLMQQGNTDQLRQILNHHVVQGKELGASDILGQETQVDTVSGDRLTVDGTGTMVVLVPTGLSVARVGDEVFVRREVAAVTAPAVTVSTAAGQQQQGQQGQQQDQQQGQTSAQAGSGQAQSGQQDRQQQTVAQPSGQGQAGQQQGQQQQATAQPSDQQQQGQQGGQQQQATAAGTGQGGDGQQQGRPIGEQRDLLRAAMVVEPGIEADNGVIHGINEVLVPQKLEQQLTQAQGQTGGQQQGQQGTQQQGQQTQQQQQQQQQ